MTTGDYTKLVPLMPPTDEEERYDAYYSRRTLYWDFNVVGKARSFRSLCRRFGVPLRGVRVADVGFGSGAILFEFSRDCALSGVEFSRQAIRRVQTEAIRRGRPHPDLRHWDAASQSLPYADHSLDVVIMSHVLEHFSDDKSLVVEANRVLVPGGWLVVMLPLDDDVPTNNRDHIRRYDEVSARSLLEVNGFEVVGTHLDLSFDNVLHAASIQAHRWPKSARLASATLNLAGGWLPGSERLRIFGPPRNLGIVARARVPDGAPADKQTPRPNLTATGPGAHRSSAIASMKEGVHHALRLAMIRVPERRIWEKAIVRLGHAMPHSRVIQAIGFDMGKSAIDHGADNGMRVALLPNGAKLYVTLEDHAHRTTYTTGLYEPDTTAFLLRLLRPGDTFVDVGANVGYFTCLAAVAGAHVHAFEPNPHVRKLLERSIELNGVEGRCVVNAAALTSTDGSVNLLVSRDKSNCGLSSLWSWPEVGAHDPLSVPAMTLDAYCSHADLSVIRVLKLDVEGAEPDVLRGAANLLEKTPPEYVICEISSRDDGDRSRSVERILRGAGYDPFEIAADGSLRTLDAGWRQRNVCFVARRSGRAFER